MKSFIDIYKQVSPLTYFTCLFLDLILKLILINLIYNSFLISIFKIDFIQVTFIVISIFLLSNQPIKLLFQPNKIETNINITQWKFLHSLYIISIILLVLFG